MEEFFWRVVVKDTIKNDILSSFFFSLYHIFVFLYFMDFIKTFLNWLGVWLFGYILTKLIKYGYFFVSIIHLFVDLTVFVIFVIVYK